MPNSEFSGEVNIPGGKGHVREPVPFSEPHRLKWPLLTLPEQSEGFAKQVEWLVREHPGTQAYRIGLTIQDGLIEQTFGEDVKCLFHVGSLFGKAVQREIDLGTELTSQVG